MARRKEAEEHENTERWLVSYADFITLLFAFFVILYATSNRNEEKQKEFQESIRKYMKIFAVMTGGGAGGTANSPGAVFEPIDGVRRQVDDNKQIQKEIDKIIDSNMSPAERREQIPEVRADRNGIRIVLSTNTFFQNGSAKMRQPAIKVLATVADILKRTPYRLTVEGHTDDQPVQNGGPYETNWELAGARAASVVRYLAKVHGIDAKKMSAVSFGDQHPVAANDTEENRAKNRRIEILISTREESEE